MQGAGRPYRLRGNVAPGTGTAAGPVLFLTSSGDHAAGRTLLIDDGRNLG